MAKNHEGFECTWDEFYEMFFALADKKKPALLQFLTEPGPAGEVADIISNLQDIDMKAANRLLKMAVDAKLVFAAIDIGYLYGCDNELFIRAVRNSEKSFTEDDIEELYGVGLEGEFLIDLCREYNIEIPEDLRADYLEDDFDEEDEDDFEEDFEEDFDNDFEEDLDDDYEPEEYFGGIPESGFDSAKAPKKHPGKCDRNCAECPPHYGYRYGRWYYGHDHTHGCEFGGNRGSGQMD